MERKFFFVLVNLLSFAAKAQEKLQNGWWRMQLIRTDGVAIPCNFEVQNKSGKTILFFRNGEERIRVDQVKMRKDSVFIEMPVFESRFSGQISKNGTMEGNWIKGTSSSDQVVHFIAVPGIKERITISEK